MLIQKPKAEAHEVAFSQLMKACQQFLPDEQIRKFKDFEYLIEDELMNEAREPEIENTVKDLFNALHEKNVQKLLKVLQGDKQKIFYAYKKQLEQKQKLTKKEAETLKLINEKEVSLLTIATM